MMETKILFLDIDGPLATDECFLTTRFDVSDKVSMPYAWNNHCCAALAMILVRTDAKIVISSDWRTHYSLDELKAMFKHYQLDPTSIIGFTSKDFDRFTRDPELEQNRATEIMHWVNLHRITKWCAVDDMLLFISNFVHIEDTVTGISEDKMNQIIELLT